MGDHLPFFNSPAGLPANSVFLLVCCLRDRASISEHFHGINLHPGLKADLFLHHPHIIFPESQDGDLSVTAEAVPLTLRGEARRSGEDEEARPPVAAIKRF